MGMSKRPQNVNFWKKYKDKLYFSKPRNNCHFLRNLLVLDATILQDALSIAFLSNNSFPVVVWCHSQCLDNPLLT